MREIKFRVWDKINKKMYEWGQFRIKVNRGGGCQMMLTFNAVPKGPYELMQYTGLKDENGKEIYESDIIGYDLCSKNDIAYGGYKESGAVKYIDDGFFVELDDSNFMRLKAFLDYEAEVIGNIYENPKLKS